MFAAPSRSAGTRDALARLGWQDFEHLLSEHYRDQGYRVEHAMPAPSLKALGSGTDLRLRRGNESLIVQCRQWDADEVAGQDVSELLSLMLNEASTGGIFVTRGRFSSQALALARRQPRLQLVDGDLLRVMLKLPDHLEGPARGKAGTRKKASTGRRTSHASPSPLLPIGLGIVILLLIGVLAWRVSHPRTPPASEANPSTVASAEADDEPNASRTAPSAVPVAQAAATPRPAGSRPADDAARELAARARLRGSPAPRHESPVQTDDGMKVLEQNTREVGSAH